MHSATCPSCGTRVELDFEPVAGQVWCPTCQKPFSPPVVREGAERADKADRRSEQNGSVG